MRQSGEEVAEKIAQSNAAVFAKVAASLMGGNAGQGTAKMRAGILCFDEININDPFTAIALKGVAFHRETQHYRSQQQGNCSARRTLLA